MPDGRCEPQQRSGRCVVAERVAERPEVRVQREAQEASGRGARERGGERGVVARSQVRLPGTRGASGARSEGWQEDRVHRAAQGRPASAKGRERTRRRPLAQQRVRLGAERVQRRGQVSDKGEEACVGRIVVAAVRAAYRCGHDGLDGAEDGSGRGDQVAEERAARRAQVRALLGADRNGRQRSQARAQLAQPLRRCARVG